MASTPRNKKADEVPAVSKKRPREKAQGDDDEFKEEGPISRPRKQKAKPPQTSKIDPEDGRATYIKAEHAMNPGKQSAYVSPEPEEQMSLDPRLLGQDTPVAIKQEVDMVSHVD